MPTDQRERSTYRLISSDGHIVEPPDVWVDRVPAKYRDRCPRIERFPDGDAWIIEGVNDPVNFGWNACAGNDPKSMNGWARHDEIRRDCYDSWRTIQASMAGVPRGERDLMLAGNAQRLYKFGQ